MWRKTLGLVVLILVLAGGTWAVVYYSPVNKNENRSSGLEARSSSTNDSITVLETGNNGAEQNIKIVSDIKAGDKVGNPISVTGKVQGIINWEGMGLVWKLTDKTGANIANGEGYFLGDQGDFEGKGRYADTQDAKDGYLEISVKRGDLSIAADKIAVELETKKQTVEIYLAPKRSPCGEVVAVKHDITAVTGAIDDYYEAVLWELIKGLTEEEMVKYDTYVTSSAKLFWAKKTSEGRMAADLDSNLITDQTTKCDLQFIKNQISKSLRYVVRPGLTRDGEVSIDSMGIDAVMEELEFKN